MNYSFLFISANQQNLRRKIILGKEKTATSIPSLKRPPYLGAETAF